MLPSSPPYRLISLLQDTPADPAADHATGAADSAGMALVLFISLIGLLSVFFIVVVLLMISNRRHHEKKKGSNDANATETDAWAAAGDRAEPYE